MVTSGGLRSDGVTIARCGPGRARGVPGPSLGYGLRSHGRAGTAGVPRPIQRTRGAGPAARRRARLDQRACSSSAARPASARRRCCATPPSRPSGFRVAQVSGVESEMELPFAGLHQLCAPLLDRLDALPAPQQDALRVALGLCGGGAPDRFLVGPGRRSPCWRRSPRSSRCCASWTICSGSTTPPAQVLAFVARRLLAEPIAIVFAVREPSDERAARGAAGAARSRGSAARTRGALLDDGRPRPARRARRATGSSPRRAATRSRCSSCRGA